jgi:hypothetical protein
MGISASDMVKSRWRANALWREGYAILMYQDTILRSGRKG